MRPLSLALICSILLLVAAACGGGDGAPGASGSPPASSSLPPGRTAQPLPSAGESNAKRVIDLATEAPATLIEGADTGDFFTDLPAMATGDVNGDGVADLLIGARFGDGPQNSRKDAGEAYVIFGRKQLPPSIDLAAGQQDLTVYGARSDDNLGWFGLIADVNHDGIDDIVLASPSGARPDDGSRTGVVYVIFGKSGLPRIIDLATQPADITILGADALSSFGESIAAADVNGDGITDLVIGATFARRPSDLSAPGAQAGAAYVIYGSQHLSSTIDVRKGEYDVAVYGAKDQPHSDEVGNHVAAGDLNGDGIADIVIDGEAADGPNNSRSVAGDVYVIYGSHNLKKVMDLAKDEYDAVIWGAEQNDTLGFNLRVAPVSGGSGNDLVMVARLASGPDNRVPQAGELHIFPGTRLTKTIDIAGYAEDAYLYGHSAADSIGYGLGAVDLAGDGVDELYVGAPSVAGGPGHDRPSAGVAYVLSVRQLRGAADISSLPLDLVIYGAHAGDGLGAGMTAGDLDGDGKPELALLAVRSNGPDGTRPQAGEIYILKP